MQFSTTTERGVDSIKGDGKSTAVGSLLLNKSETSFTIREYKWNHQPKRFHGHSTCRYWSPGGPSQQGQEHYRKDPGTALQNGLELGKYRSRCPLK